MVSRFFRFKGNAADPGGTEGPIGVSGLVHGDKPRLPLFEVALVLLRFDHIARFIVNADHSLV